MKRILLFAFTLLVFVPGGIAKMKKLAPAPAEEHINWVSVQDLPVLMKGKPKRVYIDMYTDWCGWCKKMEATTFTNPDVVRYMNENFYCVRFNAERKDTFRFMGKEYYYDPAKRIHTFASELMTSLPSISYPTSIFMEPYFQGTMPVPGYQDVKGMEMVVRFFTENKVKSQPLWENWQKTFVQTWGLSNGPVTSDMPPVGR